MSAASTYTKNNVINALLRGVALPLPADGTFVSLHTADPGPTGTASEMSLAEWPNYVRRRAEGEGEVGTGWEGADNGASSNLNQITFPGMAGFGSVTVTHWAMWDAIAGGNCLAKAAATTPRTLQSGDVLVFDVGTLTLTQE